MQLEAEQKNAQLLEENRRLRSALFRMTKDTSAEEHAISDSKYLALLHKIKSQTSQLEKLQSSREIETLVIVKEEKERECRLAAEKLASYKRELLRSARSSRTGKPVAMSLVHEIEDGEMEISCRLEEARDSYVAAKLEMDRFDKENANNEELADNITLVDFEQLKIENTTLSEKIQDRSRAIETERKKNHSCVTLAAHYEEKIRSLNRQANEYQAVESEIAKEHNETRQVLIHAKNERDTLLSYLSELQQKAKVGNSASLLNDFDKTKSQIDILSVQVRELERSLETPIHYSPG